MSLLFDQNLSHQLPRRLADLFPGSQHVRNVGMRDADDEEIWRYAAREDLVVVTKDSDFPDRVRLRGAPPKVVWLTIGNCTTATVERLVRERADDIRRLIETVDADLLIVY